MKTIPIEVDSFPKLREDRWVDPNSISSVGRAMKDLFFQRFADIVITNTNPHSNIDFTRASIPTDKIVVDFYKWDYNLDRYRYPENEIRKYLDGLLSDYIKYKYANEYEIFLRELISKGINKCVGMDFSLWYDQPGPTLIYNLYLNMCRLKQAQDIGMDVIFNWNNAMVEWEPIFAEILPEKVPIVMVDSNHELTTDQLKREIAALEMFTKYSKVDIFIIQAGRRGAQDMLPFLERLKEKGIRYFFVPGQTSLLNGVRTKQEYLEELGVESVGCDSKKCRECPEKKCQFRGNDYYQPTK
jgi:hypothetical protein